MVLSHMQEKIPFDECLIAGYLEQQGCHTQSWNKRKGLLQKGPGAGTFDT